MSNDEFIVILGSNSRLAESVMRLLELQNRRFIAFNRCTDIELEELLIQLKCQSSLKSCTIFYFNSLHSKVDSVINFEVDELFDHIKLSALRYRYIIKMLFKCIPSGVVVTLISSGSLMEKEDRPVGASYALAKIIHANVVRLLVAHYRSNFSLLAINFKLPFFKSGHHEFWPEILKASLSKGDKFESDLIAYRLLSETYELQNLGARGFFEKDILY